MGAGRALGFRMGSLLLGQSYLLAGSTQNPDYQLSLSPWVLVLKALCWASKGVGYTVLPVCLQCLSESRSVAEVATHVRFVTSGSVFPLRKCYIFSGIGWGWEGALKAGSSPHFSPTPRSQPPLN